MWGDQFCSHLQQRWAPTTRPAPSGWWLLVVCLSLMHRLLSKHFNPVVGHAVASIERAHCAVAHCRGVLSPPAHSQLAPPRHRGLGRGRGPVTDPNVWSQNPAGSSWWGQCVRFALWTSLMDHFPSWKKKKEKKKSTNSIMFTYIMLIRCFYSLITRKMKLY